MLYRENGQFKTTYHADQQIFPILQDRVAIAALLAVAFIAVPMFASEYLLRAIFVPFLILSLAALGLNILVGYCGQISLGTGAFMTPKDAHYDALETRSPEVREAALMRALAAQIAHAKAHAPAFAASLATTDAAGITGREALARLPVIRKHELLERQRDPTAPDLFGGFSALGWGATPAARRALRVFASPGPIHEPEGSAPDYWRMVDHSSVTRANLRLPTCTT